MYDEHPKEAIRKRNARDDTIIALTKVLYGIKLPHDVEDADHASALDLVILVVYG